MAQTEQVGGRAETSAAGARTHRHLIELDGRLSVGFRVDGGQFVVEAVGEVGELAVQAESAASRAGVAVVALHVLGVHRHETQHQQVHATGHHSQTEQDEHQTERHVTRTVR